MNMSHNLKKDQIMGYNTMNDNHNKKIYSHKLHSKDSIVPTDLDELVLSDDYCNSTTSNINVQRRINGKFVNRIPFEWITKACCAGNNTCRVAVCCYYQHGFKSQKSDKSFHISTGLGEKFGFNNRQQNSALKILAEIGLVQISERKGKHYLIEVIESEDYFSKQ